MFAYTVLCLSKSFETGFTLTSLKTGKIFTNVLLISKCFEVSR